MIEVAMIAAEVSEAAECAEAAEIGGSIDTFAVDDILECANESLGECSESTINSSSELTSQSNLVDNANEMLGQKESELQGIEKEESYNSTYQERMNRTPTDGQRGEWTGERGESKYIPNYEYMKDYLNNNYKLDGIEYNNAIPDFSPCSKSTVKIDNMSEKRYGQGGNFEQCDKKCAESWNNSNYNGKSDWTSRDVANWREENKYSWHERNDRTTCDLISTKVNDYFNHLGGVSECKKAYNIGGGFDA